RFPGSGQPPARIRATDTRSTRTIRSWPCSADTDPPGGRRLSARVDPVQPPAAGPSLVVLANQPREPGAGRVQRRIGTVESVEGALAGVADDDHVAHAKRGGIGQNLSEVAIRRDDEPVRM